MHCDMNKYFRLLLGTEDKMIVADSFSGVVTSVLTLSEYI